MGAVTLLAVAGVVASSCTAPGQITLQGPWTVPLPTITTVGPATTVPVIPGVCNTVYTPSGIVVAGVTVTVPSISVNVSGIIDVPNVKVNVPAATLALPSFQVNCLGVGLITLTANVVIPATVAVKNAQLNLNTGVLSLQNPSVTINGVGLQFPGLGGLVIPISLTIPIQDVTVPL